MQYGRTGNGGAVDHGAGAARRARADGRPTLRLPEQRPFRQPRMRFRPTEVVSADELESIHDASLRILAEIGMDFLDAGSRELLAAAGATSTASASASTRRWSSS